MKAKISWDESRKKWKVDLRLPRGAQGKTDPRIRRWKPTQAEAEEEARILEARFQEYGTQGARIQVQEWHRIQVLEARLKGVGTLEDAVDHFLAAQGGNLVKMPLEDAWESFLGEKKKQGTSMHWQNALANHSRRMQEALPGVTLGDVTRERIQGILEAYSRNPESQGNLLRGIRNFMGWCRRQGWIQVNPAEGIQAPRVIRGTPGTLDPDQVEAIFRKMEESAPWLIPWNAIRCFAGVRTESAKWITRGEIHLDAKALTIHPSRNKARGKREYLEDCGENLWAWLEAYLPRLKTRDPSRIYGGQMTNETGHLIQGLGIQAPRNAFRHTFATMHLAKHKDPGRTALQMCHRDSPRTLFLHYRGLASAQQADKFFSILPGS